MNEIQPSEAQDNSVNTLFTEISNIKNIKNIEEFNEKIGILNEKVEKTELQQSINLLSNFILFIIIFHSKNKINI